MKLLATQAMPQMRAHAAPGLGRLVTPRHYPSMHEHGPELVWAADNDCFQGLDRPAWLAMLDAISPCAHRGRLTRARQRLARLEREKENGPADRIICARFASECASCGAELAKGQSIRYNRAAGARCTSCA